MEIKTIHSEFYQILNGYLLKRINNKDDVADLLQEIFIKIQTNIHKLSAREKLKSWIFSIAHNTVIDYYRGRQGNDKVEIDDTLGDITALEKEHAPSIDFDRCMQNFIQQLPVEYRNIIIDSEIRGIRQKDLADKYGVAYSSVRSKVQRARARLRDMILDCCTLEFDSRGTIMDATPNKPGNSFCGNCN